MFEGPRSVPGPLGSVLARLLGALRRLGRDLGASWGRLGALWGSEARNHQKPMVFLRFLKADCQMASDMC